MNPVFNDNLTSINNTTGHGDINLYNWEGRWVFLGKVRAGEWIGRLKDGINNKVDAVEIACTGA